MKLGPNSLKAAASRWPGRGCSRLRRRPKGRRNRRNGPAAGTSANGKKASCRASVRQILIRRAQLRMLRRIPNLGRSRSEAPSRMERSHTPCQVAESYPVEPGPLDHLGEFALPWEAPDAFHEIDIGVAITGDDLAEQRHDLKAVKIIERLQQRGDLGREFETEEPSARPQHAAGLGERRID